jgi:hypothetical protein
MDTFLIASRFDSILLLLRASFSSCTSFPYRDLAERLLVALGLLVDIKFYLNYCPRKVMGQDISYACVRALARCLFVVAFSQILDEDLLQGHPSNRTGECTTGSPSLICRTVHSSSTATTTTSSLMRSYSMHVIEVACQSRAA